MISKLKYTLLILAFSISTFCGNSQSRYTVDGNSRQVSAHRYPPRHAIEHRHHNGVQEGYRGFVDVNFFAGNDGVFTEFNVVGGGFATTHGYQFNPNVFLGGGMKFQYNSFDNFDNAYSMPFYADFMVNMTDSKISPFFDLKLGYSFTEIEGVYLSPSFGIRFGLADNLAINTSIGYSLQGYSYEESFLHYYYNEKASIHNLNLSVGIEF